MATDYSKLGSSWASNQRSGSGGGGSGGSSSGSSKKIKYTDYGSLGSNWAKSYASAPEREQEKLAEMKSNSKQAKLPKVGSAHSLNGVVDWVKKNIIDQVANSAKNAGNVTGAVGQAVVGAIVDKTPEQKARTKESSLAQFNQTPFGKIAGVKQGKDGKLMIPKSKDEAKQARQILGQTAEDTLNLASVLPVGRGASVAKTAVESGAKTVLKAAGKGAAEGAAYGAGYGAANTLKEDNPTLGSAAKNIGTGAAIGGAAGGLITGAAGSAGKLAKVADKKAGQAAEAFLKAEESSNALRQIGEHGVIGGANRIVSDAGKKLAYATSDLASKTKVGRFVINAKDDFLSKWVTNFSPLYKTLKRSDFEGRTTGAHIAAREAIGNANRALSFAAQHIENDAGAQKVLGGLRERGGDFVKNGQLFDEYAKVRSDLDLAAAGKKEFTPEHAAELTARAEKLKTDGHDFNAEYQGLVEAYKNLNEFRYKEGLISKDDYTRFKNEPFDYIRIQREVPDWMRDKPAAGQGKGSAASITGSSAIQKRNKYAAGEQLSPSQTYLKATQQAYVEAYRNRAAKTVTGLLQEAGEGKLIRATDTVREKQELLSALKETKPIVTQLNRVLRSNKTQARRLQTALNELNRKGVALRTNKAAQREAAPEFDTEMLGRLKELAGKSNNTRELIRAMIAEDPKGLRQIRNMIENRDAKLGPLLDKIELMSRDLADLHGQRSAVWHRANSLKTTVDKKGLTSLSYLDDGVENIVKVDPSIASAIHDWDKQSQNVLMGTLRVTNNIFKYGTTALNAGFALPNFVADQVGSGVNSKAFLYTHNPRNFVSALFMTLGKPLSQKDAEILAKYTGGNKGQLTINQYEKAYTAERYANELYRKNSNLLDKTYTVIRHPKEGFRTMLHGLKETIGATEELTRIQNFRGSYNKAVKEGAGEANAGKLANQAARENSVDFLEAGSYGRVVNSFIPYFNAAIQGTRTTFRNIGDRPVSTAGKFAALVGTPVALSTMWNVSDPQRKAIYDDIPEYVKETNFVMIAPGASWNAEKRQWDGVYLMKKPQEYAAMADPVRRFIEYQAGSDPEATKTFAGFLQNQKDRMPGDVLSSLGPVDFTDKYKFLSSVTPQILKPTAEAILNKNFFTGKDIVPTSLQGLPVDQQKYENYSRLTSAIAGQFGTSPLKVDQWIRQTFGEVGTNAINTVDRLSGAPANEQGGRSLDTSISRRFYGAPGGETANAFYKTYGPALAERTATSKRVTELVKEGKPEQARRLANEYNSTVGPRFKQFFTEYQDSPNYDPKWDDNILALSIPVSERGFAARARQK